LVRFIRFYKLNRVSSFTLGESTFNLIIFIIFFGLDWVATVPPTVRLAADAFGKQSGIVYGWIFASHQLGAATAAFGGGMLHSLFGDYELTFLLAGAFCITASGLVMMIQKTAVPAVSQA
jgi:predicted MFS family arabinose efflux permease